MSYRLQENPTPTWAGKDQLKVNPASIPSYFRQAAQTGQQNPHSAHTQERGRWNLIRSHQRNEETGSVDLGLLDSIDLRGKWENKLNPQQHNEKTVLPWFLDRELLVRFFFKTLRSNPFLPFTLRGLAFAFSAIGLALACSVYVQTKQYTSYLAQQPSTIMAITVLTVAMVYLCYTIYDEYFGQPLGLRRGASKMKFVFMDVIFMIFSSANLALAFSTMLDDYWACDINPETLVCQRQRALVGLIFVSLVMWFLTFMVSIYRMMDKVSH